MIESKWQIHGGPAPSLTVDPHLAGRVAALLIRGERMWLLEPTGERHPTTTDLLLPATVTIRNLNTGEELKRYTAPITRTTAQTTNAGTADTDLVCGVWWSFVPGGLIMAASGGDRPMRAIFDAETGEPITLPGLGVSLIGSGMNCATTFTAHADVPFIVSGGNNSHSMFGNGGIHDLRGTGRTISYAGYKQWNIGLIHAGTQAAYRLDELGRTSAGAIGTRVWGMSATLGGIGRELPNQLLFNRTGNDGSGYRKPAIMLEDGRIALLTYTETTSPGITPPANAAVNLCIIKPVKTGKLESIIGFTSWNQLQADILPINRTAGQFEFPQLATAGSLAVAFSPLTSTKQPHLTVVDCDAKKVLWTKSLPATAFTRKVWPYLNPKDNFPRHLANTVAIHRGEIILAEFNGTHLICTAYDLATGADHGRSEIKINTPVPMDSDHYTIHSVEATPAGVVYSLIYRHRKRTYQSVLCVDQAAAPAPEPPPTPIPTAVQEVLDFAKPRLSTEQFQAIERILTP